MSNTTASICLNDILNSTDYLLGIEATNNKVFNSLDYNLLKTNLLSWVGKGYPDSYIVFTFPVVGLMENGLYKCSDYTDRSLEDYATFFLKKELSELITTYQAKVGGIRLSHSTNTNSVNILATKL